MNMVRGGTNFLDLNATTTGNGTQNNPLTLEQFAQATGSKTNFKDMPITPTITTSLSKKESEHLEDKLSKFNFLIGG